MNFKSLTIFALAMFSFGASAAMLVNPLEKLVVKSEQFKGVDYKLERALGRQLSKEERADLATVLSDDSKPQIVDVNDPGSRNASRALYCIGAGYEVGAELYRAVCVSLSTWRAYDLVILGVGGALELKASVTRFLIGYNSAEFQGSRDPIPGNYGLVSIGGSVGAGLAFYGGDAGNKSASGFGLNLGLGADFGSISMLVIQ